jgi:hypothetical protein
VGTSGSLTEEVNCPKPSSYLVFPDFIVFGLKRFMVETQQLFYEYRPLNLSYRPKVSLHSSLNMFILKALIVFKNMFYSIGPTVFYVL